MVAYDKQPSLLYKLEERAVTFNAKEASILPWSSIEIQEENSLVHDNYLHFTETGAVSVCLVMVWKLCGI